MPRPVTRPKKPHPAPSPFKASDVCTYLLEHAATMAPADVESLVARSVEMRVKAARDGSRHALFHRQLDVALQLLGDHVEGECPQIPYHTVGLLAAALYYWLDPIDVIPDFVPVAGTSDDALVLALAFQLAAAGLERYCTFKGIAKDALFATAKPTR